jgi:hypothetical protein
MTIRSYTDGDEIPAQPAIRSAWDAVKSEVTVLALDATSTVLGVTAGTLFAVGGNYVSAACFGAFTLIKASLSASRVARVHGILKNIPAPKP